MANSDLREQHNHGSGTFVGGDVHGGIWQIFLPPYKKATSSDPEPSEQKPEQDNEEIDDYEDRFASLFFSVWIATSAGLSVVYAITGDAWVDNTPSPGVTQRIGFGLVGFFVCIATAAAFFARLAQVLEIWSEQCAITAVQNRGRLVSRPPASFSRALAALAAVASVAAELLASFYGWSSFGAEVAQRARLAEFNASANATTARAATKRLES
jgi:hypothetical protein